MYMMGSASRRALYAGVTAQLFEHKNDSLEPARALKKARAHPPALGMTMI